MQLTADETVENGKPIHVRYSSEQRVSGRIRLTHGTERLTFTLLREGKEPVRGDGPRVRGREGELVLSEWGSVAPGEELVVRFEGEKAWVRVT